MKDLYTRLVIKFFVIVLITFTISLFVVNTYIKNTTEKGMQVVAYKMSDYDAIQNYNKNSVAFLLSNYKNTNAILSPLCIQSAYYYYMLQNNKPNDALFYIFEDGFINFQYSQKLLDEPCISCFTAGTPNQIGVLADIQADTKDKLVQDEINATFNTLTDNELLFKATSATVYGYNIYGIMLLENSISNVACNLIDDNYVIEGNFEYYNKDNLIYIKIPLEDSKYSLILEKGTNLYYDKLIPLYTEEKHIKVIMPKLNYESAENPARYFKDTFFGDFFELDSNLENLTTICHLDIKCNETEDEIVVDKDTLDFSRNCIFMIENEESHEYVLLGNIL